MCQVARSLIHPGLQITILNSHITKQSEVNSFLKKIMSKSFAYYIITSQVAQLVSEYKIPHISNYYVSTLKQDM